MLEWEKRGSGFFLHIDSLLHHLDADWQESCNHDTPL